MELLFLPPTRTNARIKQQQRRCYWNTIFIILTSFWRFTTGVKSIHYIKKKTKQKLDSPRTDQNGELSSDLRRRRFCRRGSGASRQMMSDEVWFRSVAASFPNLVTLDIDRSRLNTAISRCNKNIGMFSDLNTTGTFRVQLNAEDPFAEMKEDETCPRRKTWFYFVTWPCRRKAASGGIITQYEASQRKALPLMPWNSAVCKEEPIGKCIIRDCDERVPLLNSKH